MGHGFLKFLLVAGTLIMFTLPATAALIGRNLDGNIATYEAFYDDVLDITWLADANLAKTQVFGVSGISSSGKMDWSEAEDWFSGMNAANYLGFNDWRLPTMIDIGGDGCNEANVGTDCGFNVLTRNSDTGEVYSELAYHYHENFGALSSRRTDGTLNSTEDFGILNAPDPSGYLPLFSNIEQFIYWIGLEYAPDPTKAWRYGAAYGHQEELAKSFNVFSWAVKDGDVGSVVPVPAGVWLFGSAVLGLAGLKRRR